MTVEIDSGAGVGAAAGTFKVVGQRPNILIQGGAHVVDAMTIDVQETTYGIYFSFTISRTEWEGAGTQNNASYYTGLVQSIAAYAPVIAVSYAQDINAAGGLIDTLIVTVETPDGLNVANVTVPMGSLGGTAPFAKIDATVATLTATAALT